MSLTDLAVKLGQFGISFGKLSHYMLSDIKPKGITFLHFRTLQYLATDEAVTLSQISECLDMTLPNTSREIKKLLEKGLIVKKDHLKDKRIQLITLSKSGADLVSTAFEKLEKEISNRYKQLNSKEIDEVIKALDLLSEKLLLK